MRRFAFALACAAMLTPALFGQADSAQNDQPIPIAPGTKLHELYVHPTSAQKQLAAPLAGSTIPSWNYSVVSPIDGKTYAGTIIGVNPTTRPAQTTVIPTVVVPVRLVFKYSSTVSYIFDPTAGDPGCIGAGHNALSLFEGSPLVGDFKYVFGATTVGTTQYTDAFQRANFWSDISATGANYHTLIGVAPMPLQIVTVTSANTGNPDGSVASASGQCGTNTTDVNEPGLVGIVNVNDWDPIAQSLITKLGINPNSFVFFLFYNAVMSEGNPTNLDNCCILGYHSSVGSQTYGVGDFEGRDQTLFSGTADTSALSHEIAEWMNDPSGNNPTPAWGPVGQVTGCQANYEVGDPLSGTLMPPIKMANGFTYHVQELAFFDWYYRISPSIGVNGWYSDNDTFTTDAGAVCK